MKRALGFMLLCACACSSPAVPVPAGLTHTTGLANNHVPSCVDSSQCGTIAEPPAGGPHCGSWLPCRVWATAQNRCEWIHNLEHGHMVMAYNCPSGCDDVVQALTAFHQSLPSPKRAMVTPDPSLKSKVAAMVWGYTWAGDSVDTAMLEAVRSVQDQDAPEPGLGCNP
jgi:hypothetical protein